MCLADFCDIFRCEVFENQRKDHFWEKKLCREDRLMVRRRRCEVIGGCTQMYKLQRLALKRVYTTKFKL